MRVERLIYWVRKFFDRSMASRARYCFFGVYWVTLAAHPPLNRLPCPAPTTLTSFLDFFAAFLTSICF
jgi:hypothetical protein